MATNSTYPIVQDSETSESVLGAPFADNLLKRAIALTKKSVEKWSKVVIKIGPSDIDTTKYVDIFLNNLEELYDDLHLDIESIHDKMLDRITHKLEALEQVCIDLQIPMPVIPYENTSLAEIHSTIAQTSEKLHHTAATRRQELAHLNRHELDLCTSLGRPPAPLPASPLPLPPEIDAFRQRIEALETEKMEREERFFQAVEDIANIRKQLELEPPTERFEHKIATLPEFGVLVTDRDTEQLAEYHHRLLSLLQSAKDEMHEYRAKLEGLWDKLEVNIAERSAFIDKNKGCGRITINAFKAEIARCEELKRANIQMFIERQRDQLRALWEKCQCDVTQQIDSFLVFDSDCYGEDLFDLFAIEIAKWEEYYATNKELLDGVKRHQRLWEEAKQLDENATGGDRYKNRGANLLKEGRKRKGLEVRLDALEKRLLELANDYQVAYGRGFLVGGKTVGVYLAELHESSRNDAKVKLSARKQQREMTTMLKSPMNLFAATPVKRRNVATTPQTEQMSKRLKVAVEKRRERNGSASAMPKLCVGKVRRLSKQKRRSRNKRLSYTVSPKKDDENKGNLANVQYKMFEDEISQRRDWRSTAFGLGEAGSSKD